ncbi:hypothetical protein EW026_g3622 [Hermanssonia centrifuga]|uniref:Kinetochore protein NDC80 n=1 Tax=Hermanssonia centrifuga TaxID=98765 RepID=A0A4S4KJL2_9APHY|nr:hypothetical protein EW026_g3622 [Hermanssonia centrifuga]
MRQDVYNWLKETEYDIHPNVLMNITGRDFRGIFQHLICLLDPEWPFDMDKKLDDQVIPPLQALHYPFAGQIDLKWLAAPGAQYSWPSLLGMLHWLAEMGKARLHYLESKDPTLQDEEDVPAEFRSPHHHQALAFGHYIEAYEIFLQGADVYPEQEQRLEERYAKKDEQVVGDLQQHREKLTMVQEELKKLVEDPPPIQQLQKSNGYLKQDRVKFEECIRLYEERKASLINGIAREKADIEQAQNTLERLKAEQVRLADVVKVQNLSPEEVVRMNTEHESLTRDLENLKNKLADSARIIQKLEVSLGRKITEVEEALDAYTNLLSSLGLFPPLPPPLEDVDLKLELNSAAANPNALLGGADVREVVKPGLATVAEMKRIEKAQVEDKKTELENELDQLITACENMEEEVVEVMNKANALNDQADELREIAQREALAGNAEAARLERDLAQARTAAMTNGVGVKSRLQALQIAYREQVDKVTRLRDETVRAIIKNSSDIVEFKEEVQRQLRNLRDYAEAN